MIPRRKRLCGLTVALAVVALSAMAALHSPTIARAAGKGGAYKPLPPSRILDTRDGTGGLPIEPLGQAHTLDAQVAGKGGVPMTATAAVLNVTVTSTTAASYLTVYPTGAAQPVASNLNWVAGQTIPNLVEVGLGTGGKVTVYNAAGRVDVIFDVAGYVDPSLAPGQGLYQPMVPARILDTRDGTGGVPVGPLGQGGTLTLQVAGGTVPATASGVILNVTVTNPTAVSYLTVYPSDQAQPVVSNLNFVGGQTIPNRVIVKLSTDGKVTFYNARGSVDVLADIGGWFTDGSNPTAAGSTFVPLTPSRILDTRDGTGGFPVSTIGPKQGIPVQVAGRGGVPLMTDAAPPNAVVANVTATGGSEASYATLWPDGDTRPVASDLNWSTNQTIPNLVVVKLGGSGVADLYNAAGCAHVVVDVVGYYTGPTLPAAATALSRIPNCPPVARAGASLAYDAARHVVVLFGGVTAEGEVMSDTWTWDGANWTQQMARPGAPGRMHASMAYDAATQTVVLFGGSNGDPNQPLLRDTWSWDGMSWTPKNPPTSPPSVEQRPMAYDAARGKLVLVTTAYPYDASQTWTWNGATWTQEQPAVEPPFNYDSSMTYDSTRNRIVLFGGWRNAVPRADTWTWDGTNWTDATPVAAPPARYNAALADDPILHQALLFGGAGSRGAGNDTWAWNGSAWTQLSPATSPPAISDGSMVGDPQAGVVLLFGGRIPGGFLATSDGTWTWDGSTWSARH